MQLDYSVTSIPDAHNGHTGSNIRIIYEFIASGAPLAMVVGDAKRPANNIAYGLISAVRATGAPVAVTQRKREVYLKRTDL